MRLGNVFNFNRKVLKNNNFRDVYRLFDYSLTKGSLSFVNYQLRDGKLKIPSQNYVVEEVYDLPSGGYNLGFDSNLENFYIL